MRFVGKNFTVNNRSTHPICSPLQSLTRRNQPQGVAVLFSGTGGAVHDAHGQWRHRTIELRQLGQQLAIFPDHKSSPRSFNPALGPWE